MASLNVFYSVAHGIIYMIDSTDRERLEESWQTFEKMIKSEQLEGLPLLVACNKQDLSDCMTVAEIKRVFNKSEFHKICRNYLLFMCIFHYKTLNKIIS